MKSLYLALLATLGFLTFGALAQAQVDAPGGADTTYTGHVDGLKTLTSGAVVVNLDGTFPNQKMSLFISATAKGQFPKLPVVGDTVTATGPITQYMGKSEIKLLNPSQLTWVSSAPPAAPAAQ